MVEPLSKKARELSKQNCWRYELRGKALLRPYFGTKSPNLWSVFDFKSNFANVSINVVFMS